MNPRIVRQLCDLGLVAMQPTGYWGLTNEGRDFLDQLDVLRELDDRPGAAPQSSPRRQARAGRSRGAASPPTQTRAGRDEGRAAQGRRTAKGSQ